MKQKTIITSKVEMLVVDLPFAPVTLLSEDCLLLFGFKVDNGFIEHDSITLEGNWNYLGKATELTEEYWKLIVEEHYTGLGYEDYNCDAEFQVLKTATESGLSLLKANGVEVTDRTHVFIKHN